MAKVLVNFPDEFLEEVDKVAEIEHRTRSSLIREALRRYLNQYNHEDLNKVPLNNGTKTLSGNLN